MTLERELELLRRALSARSHHVIDADEDTARAAVAAVLRPSRQGPQVLLIQRKESAADPWSGHMAFPGGRAEPEDPDLLHTARRETLEEVGVELDHDDAEVLGRLDDVQAVARGRRAPLIITPYVFQLLHEPILRPAQHEVADVLWAPIEPMLRGEVDATKEYDFEGTTYRLPGYRIDERIVWGLTYYMLQHLFAVMRGEEPEIDPRHR